MIIRLVNANLGKAKNIESDVETWGELQANSEVQDFMSGDTQAVIRETQNILDLDQAKLPSEKLSAGVKEYDYTLFFVTKKSKAGLFGKDRNNDQSESTEQGKTQLDRIEEKVDYVYNAVKNELEGETAKPAPSEEDEGPTEEELAEARRLSRGL